jgi:hypothetical protein
MKIYTVIPYYSNGIEVDTNDVKSFTDRAAASHYATGILRVEYYEIVENELNLPEPFGIPGFGTKEFNETAAKFFGGGFQNSGESETDGFSGFRV